MIVKPSQKSRYWVRTPWNFSIHEERPRPIQAVEGRYRLSNFEDLKAPAREHAQYRAFSANDRTKELGLQRGYSGRVT